MDGHKTANGFPCSSFLISMSSHESIFPNPVPRLFAIASFAAKRPAKGTAGSACRKQYSCSPSVKSLL